MIISTLENYKNAYLPSVCIHAITEALELVNECIPADGQYTLSDKTNNAKAIIMRYHTKSQDLVPYESHTQMADIQMVLDGEEDFLVCSSKGLHVEKSGEDIDFYQEKPEELTRIHLKPNAFALIFPKEAHAPGITPTTSEQAVAITKLVIKVQL